MDNRRADWRVAKTLYETEGLERVRAYQALPYVEFCGAPPKADKNCIVASVEHLPWEPEFLLCFRDLIQDTDNGEFVTVVVRVAFSTASDACALMEAENEPGVLKSLPPDHSAVLCLILVEDSDGTVYSLAWTSYIVVDGAVHLSYRFTPAIENDVVSVPGGVERAGLLVERFSCVVLDALAAIQYSTGYLVQERRHSPPSKQECKTARLKPWLREDLPRFVILRPGELRPLKGAPLGGSHSSPLPHRRRGHWALLSAERYVNKRGQRVWVRPAWIGDREWVLDGRQYKVVSTEKQTVPTQGAGNE